MTRAPWILVLALGCTEPSDTPPPDNSEVVAAAEKIDAAATKLESAATKLEASVQALEALRVEEAKRQAEVPLLPAPMSREPSPPFEGLEGAVECPTEGKCTVKRSIFSDPAMLAKHARIIPYQQDGKVVGIRFYGVRMGSLPNLLGLKNGDVVRRINAHELTSPEALLEIYAKERDAKSLTIEVERRGTKVQLELDLVD